MGDLDGFPAAPRRPRAGAWLRRGWPLGVLAAVLVLPAIAGAILFLANARDVLPLGDDALDASSSRTTGKVVASAPDDWPGGGGARITFRFEPRPGDAQVEASSFVPPEVRPPAVGTDVRIEFLPHAPELARIEGSHRAPPWSPFSRWLRLAGLPGLFVLGIYLRGAFGQRLLLSQGRLTLARVLDHRPVPGAYPPQRRVSYEFDDETRNTHRARHWVGLHTPLGARIESEATTLPVLHDTARPRSSRLAHRSDFLK
ncbi:MAG: hypothetical protein O2865_12045 [Planctomycetota bacterium]|nr:hypothetical protein [Planctomycetota bacterium]MDA0934780.1 hypothetical protein [Planctomycetota bacterium]